MNTIDTASNSALKIITNSQQKISQAAQDIATSTIDKNEVGKPTEFNSRSALAPLISIKEAGTEAQAGVKLLETANEMQQSIIDIMV